MKHRVRQGESLASIAESYGFSWKKLWDDASNRELREARGDPEVLNPGDVVQIPEKQRREESGATDTRHRFKVPGLPYKLKLVLRDDAHQPVPDAAWSIRFEGTNDTAEGTTGSDGLIEVPVPRGVERAMLRVGGVDLPVALRALDPANLPRGIQQRLANLGYDVGPIDGIVGPRTRDALRMFQTREGLEATGEPDEETVDRLRSLHEGVSLPGKPRVYAQASGAKAADKIPAADPSAEPDLEAEEEPEKSEDVDPELARLADDFDPIDGEPSDTSLEPDPSRPMRVETIQQLLRWLGFDPGPIDGIFGPRTRAAVLEFQEQAEIGVDGIVGPITSRALREDYADG